MRRYDDPVEVRKGLVTGSTGVVEAPEQFLWRGGLWKVVEVVAHWVETGPWWPSSGVAALLGGDTPTVPDAATTSALLAAREVWRGEAARGSGPQGVRGRPAGVDLSFGRAE